MKKVNKKTKTSTTDTTLHQINLNLLEIKDILKRVETYLLLSTGNTYRTVSTPCYCGTTATCPTHSRHYGI